jgi:hypothetical protein
VKWASKSQFVKREYLSLSIHMAFTVDSTTGITLIMCQNYKTDTRQIIMVKVIPLQAWTGPEGSSRLRLPDFKTIGTGR